MLLDTPDVESDVIAKPVLERVDNVIGVCVPIGETLKSFNEDVPAPSNEWNFWDLASNEY